MSELRAALRAWAPPPTITSQLGAGATSVSGTGVPGASVQIFVNGVARGAPVTVNAQGQWTISNLSQPLTQNDSVTAQETLNGLSRANARDLGAREPRSFSVLRRACRLSQWPVPTAPAAGGWR